MVGIRLLSAGKIFRFFGAGIAFFFAGSCGAAASRRRGIASSKVGSIRRMGKSYPDPGDFSYGLVDKTCNASLGPLARERYGFQTLRRHSCA